MTRRAPEHRGRARHAFYKRIVRPRRSSGAPSAIGSKTRLFGQTFNRHSLREVRGFSSPDYPDLPPDFDLHRADDEVEGGSDCACLASLALVGCGGGIEGVRARAPADLQCDAGAIVVRPASPTSPPAGPFYAEGCDKLWRYVSPPRGQTQGSDVKAILTRQASFDLSCGVDQLEFTALNADTFGVKGCDKQASYLLVCPVGGCKAVQNTQSQ